MDTSYKCRICLHYDGSGTSLFSKTNGTSVAQMINFCAGVQITEEDDLPSYACTKCCEEATSAYMFVNKCRKSDAELRTQQILSSQTADVAEEETVCADDRPEDTKEHVYVKLELCTVETLEDVADDVSLRSWQIHSEENDFLEAFDDGTYDCATPEEEYLDDSDTEGMVQSGNAPQDKEVPQEHGLVSNFGQSQQRMITSYVCCYTDCTVTFNSKQLLKEHLHALHRESETENERAHDTARHRCANCYRFFATVDDMEVHQNRLVLKQASLVPRRFGRPKLYPSVFDAPVKICCGCFERFPTTEALLEHSEKMHAVRKSASNPARPVQCQICYKLFRSEAHVRTHRIAVYKPRNHCCTICGASYSAASKLAYHQAQHHSAGKYVCAQCGACLKTEQNLKMHVLLHQEKREVCKTCGLRFYRKSNLKMHQRIHEDIYYHVCPHCPKQLKTQTQLREHLKVHTKEKPYQCRHCDKRFRYFSDRTRHEMVHTGNYPFECDGCSKKFTRGLSYYRHLGKCSHDNSTMVPKAECNIDT